MILLSSIFAKTSEAFSQNLKGTYPFYPGTNYVCYKISSPLVIDGKLDEESWNKASWTDEFQDIEGNLKPKPLYSTKVKMLWDDEYFYIGAELEEPHLWATYTERESIIFHENDFEVFIDPDGDTHNYYEYEINALGTEWDLLLLKPYRDGGPALTAWNINGLKKAVQVYGTINNPTDIDQKWTIELAFPWDVLKEATAPPRQIPQNNEQWRVNFSRVHWQRDIQNGKYTKKINPKTQKPFPEYNWVWSPQGVIAMHQPETWGFVQFSELTVGRGKTEFIQDPDEEYKWLLRQLYYQQRKYKKKYGLYASQLDLLDTEIILKDYFVLVDLKNTFSGYEITLSEPDIKEAWHIREDGKVWKTKRN